jgi:hypothetical protein
MNTTGADLFAPTAMLPVSSLARVAICHAKELWKIGMAASFTNASAAKRGLSPAPLRPLRANAFLLTPKPLHPTSLLRSEPSKVANQLMSCFQLNEMAFRQSDENCSPPRGSMGVKPLLALHLPPLSAASFITSKRHLVLRSPSEVGSLLDNSPQGPHCDFARLQRDECEDPLL